MKCTPKPSPLALAMLASWIVLALLAASLLSCGGEADGPGDEPGVCCLVCNPAETYACLDDCISIASACLAHQGLTPGETPTGCACDGVISGQPGRL